MSLVHQVLLSLQNTACYLYQCHLLCDCTAEASPGTAAEVDSGARSEGQGEERQEEEEETSRETVAS